MSDLKNKNEKSWTSLFFDPKIRYMNSKKNKNGLVNYVLLLTTLFSVITTVGIILILLTDSFHFFEQVPVLDFLTGTKWNPLIEPDLSYGVLPLVAGTMMITLGAAVIAIPVGLGSAIYLTEYASSRFSKIIKPIMEILAGVPTVVYGYFALTFITPNVLKPIFPNIQTFNALSASIAVGIMILPMVISLSEDALNAVPESIRQGAYAMGSTRFEVASKVMVPSSTLSRPLIALSMVVFPLPLSPSKTVRPVDGSSSETSSITRLAFCLRLLYVFFTFLSVIICAPTLHGKR